MGNVLAFFELPTKPAMGRDPNTPPNGFNISPSRSRTAAELLRVQASTWKPKGIDVLGVTDHSIFHSIYFFDPSGHRIELACPDPQRGGHAGEVSTT